jgi:hypothetical protein
MRASFGGLRLACGQVCLWTGQCLTLYKLQYSLARRKFRSNSSTTGRGLVAVETAHMRSSFGGLRLAHGQVCLWTGQCCFWHSLEQYLTRSQAVHLFLVSLPHTTQPGRRYGALPVLEGVPSSPLLLENVPL